VDRPPLLTRPFVLVWLSSLVTLTAVGMLLPVLPVYVDGPLDAGKTAVGLTIAAATPAAIILQPLLGKYADRRGRKGILVAGPVLYAACIASFGLVDSLTGLIVLRVLAGVGEGAMYMAPATVVNDLAPRERRGEAVSLFSLSIWLGLAAGPPLGELILRDTHFHAVWITAAVLALLGSAFAAMVPETRRARAVTLVKTHLLPRGAFAPSLVLIGELVGYAAIVSFTPLYARELGMSGAGLVFMVNAIVVLSIRGLGRKIPDRLGPRRGGTVGLALAVTGLATIALVRHPAGLYLGTTLFYMGHSLLYPALMMFVLARTSEAEGSAAVGIFTASANVGLAVGAISLGALSEAAGYPWGYAVGAMIVAIGIVTVLRMKAVAPGALPAAAEAPP
jgi:MFS family permease